MFEDDDEDMWVEKEVEGVDSSATVLSTPAIPVPVSAKPEQESSKTDNNKVEVEDTTDKGPKRDSWMTDAGGMDFGLMGALKVKKPKEDKPNPDQVHSAISFIHL
jgi:hypothetical protein